MTHARDRFLRDPSVWWMLEWVKGFADGKGFEIGEENQTPEEAAEDRNWRILEEATGGPVLCRDLSGKLVAVCDVNGPWAVEMSEHEYNPLTGTRE